MGPNIPRVPVTAKADRRLGQPGGEQAECSSNWGTDDSQQFEKAQRYQNMRVRSLELPRCSGCSNGAPTPQQARLDLGLLRTQNPPTQPKRSQ